MNRSESNLSRRDLLRLSAAGAIVGSTQGWFGSLAAHAAETAKTGAKHKSCILLYMAGGASHVDTFDPKPGNGEFKAIQTAIPGVSVSENLPRLARQMNDIALIRGMSTSEGSHPRANYLIHTGYREGVGGVIHPTIGSVVSATVGGSDPEVPNFVKIGVNRKSSSPPGYLGPAHAPLSLQDPSGGVPNLQPTEAPATFNRGLALLDELDQGFLDRKRSTGAQAHREMYRSAARLMNSAKVKAFDLSDEPAASRSAYGEGKFSEACLLARRLVEVGLPFVEIDFDGWDTHQDNFARVKTLSQQLDQGMSTLLADLKLRGLLDSTLVVWAGDFGRTPDIKGTGRGHYPRAWTTLFCGGGLKTGQVIGRTDKSGGSVEDRPVNEVDFFATICKALAIDCEHEFHTRGGRPMRVVKKGEKPIEELFV